MSTTLFDKVWDSHVVRKIEDGPDVFFIDRHFIHEVTSPVAFLGLKERGIKVLYPERTFATADHNTPTINQHLPVQDALSANQLKALEDNAAEYGISHWGLGHAKNGIVHVVGPENGITLPGATIVCGDSHTSTHGAFGAIAFGIGTSEVEMVLATQCIMQPKPKKMRINVNGKLSKGVGPKDVALYVISQLTTSGGTGYFAEYAGNVFEDMSMEGRMTVCNLSIEMGARGGMIAPDQKTFDFLEGRLYAPKGEAWTKAVEYWKTLKTDEDAVFDAELNIDAADIEPMITYGTNPGMGIGISQNIPNANQVEGGEETYKKSLAYMGFEEDDVMIGKPIDFVFLGSCTNGRIEDLQQAAEVMQGKAVHRDVRAIIIPGSQAVYLEAVKLGYIETFINAGAIVSTPTCGPCLGGYMGILAAGERAVATTNRNFRGRMGHVDSEVYLAGPYVAAASAILGKIALPEEVK